MSKTIVLINSNSCTKNESRVFKEAVSLKNAGYNVINVAYFNNNLSNEETICGIKTVRFTMHLNKWLFDTRPFLLLRNKFSFLAYLRVLVLFEYTLKIFFYYFFKANYFHCYRVYTLPIGLLLKTLSFGRKKLIYDPREYESEALGVKGIFQRLVRLVEKISLKFTDGVIVVSESIGNEYKRLYNIPKTSLVLNAPQFYEVKEYKDLFRKAFNISNDSIIFLYQGAISKGRGIKELISAFQSVETNKVIIFMGYGDSVEIVKEASKNSKNIFYHEAVDPDVLLDYTSSADIGFLILDTTCLSYYYSSPNKFFEYTQAGIPVIASELFEIKKIIECYDSGIILNDSYVELKKCIEKITRDQISSLKTNIHVMKQRYKWEEQEKVLIDLYSTI